MSDDRYLSWQEGDQVLYATGIKYVGPTVDGNGKVKNASLNVTFCEKPSADGFDGKTTTLFVTLPHHSDSVGKKIAQQRQIDAVIFALADLDPSKKTDLKTLYNAARANLAEADIKCEVTMKATPGQGLDQRTGEPKVFWNCVGFKAIEAMSKVPYESNVEYNYDDLADQLLSENQ